MPKTQSKIFLRKGHGVFEDEEAVALRGALFAGSVGVLVADDKTPGVGH